MKIGISYTVVTPETKMLFSAAAKRGVKLERIVDSESVLRLNDSRVQELDVLLQRSVSYSRGLCLAYYWEKAGARVINSYNAARMCGDKMLCSLELAKAGVPTPNTCVAFSPEATEEAAGEVGFPLVMKPLVGSWARMVNRLNDPESLRMAVEAREEMGNPWQKIYYLQEHVEKPGRDIRAFVVGEEVVAAIYRHSTEKSGWITNAGRGGYCTPCPLGSELVEVALAAASVAGDGVWGVDLMESPRGLLVHEINHTAEFRSCAAATGEDIAGRIIGYATECARN